jgi:2-(1,2-epoxy-1,2-dihydrophenyl)acetyl-CoA isomerase
MDITDLQYEAKGPVAWIRFNRPARRNALGNMSTRHLVQLCRQADQDAAVKAVVITGQGEAFCAGGDIQDTFQRGATMSEQQWSDRIREGPNVLAQLIQTMAKPVIASVNGLAMGGGATIALACDLRIASDRARFCFPFARLGLTPEFGCSYLLQRAVGAGRAMELLLLGELVDAASAQQYGLVNRVVEHAALESATAQWAAHLASLPPAAIARLKQLMQFARTHDLQATLEQEAIALGQCFTSAEHRTAVAQFLNRKAESKPA